MAVVAQLTPTPVPSGLTNGGVTGNAMMMHVQVTSAGGAGTYTFAHGLQYTPLFCIPIAKLADGVTPSASNAAVGFVSADTTATLCAIALPGNITVDVYYC